MDKKDLALLILDKSVELFQFFYREVPFYFSEKNSHNAQKLLSLAYISSLQHYCYNTAAAGVLGFCEQRDCMSFSLALATLLPRVEQILFSNFFRLCFSDFPDWKITDLLRLE